MATDRSLSYPNSLEEIRSARGWIIGLGLAFSILGIIMLASLVTTTLLTVGVLGFFLLAGGIFMAVHSFWVRKWSGFFLSLITGIFLIVSGTYMMANPIISVAALTLLLAVYFIASGILKSVYSLMTRFENWGWLFFSGLLSTLLGIMIWSQWPASSLFVFGMFMGIDLLMIGITWTVIGAAMGSMSRHRPAF